MRKILILTAVALLLSGWSATAAIPPTGEAQEAIENICTENAFRRAVVGVLAVTADGDTLVCHNHEVKMVPASNVKLISTGLALRRLGEDFRFETKIAHSGEITDGVLKGDLYIIGGGDPTTGSKSDIVRPVEQLFAEWAGMLKSAGINKIEGRIVADPRFFDNPVSENMGWTYDDLGTYYGIGPGGLNFFENQKNYYITPAPAVGGTPSIEPRYPETPWMKYLNSATTGEARSANTVYCINSTLAPYAQFAGEFPVDRKAYTLESSNRFGAYTCAYYFLNYLRNNGVAVSEEACADVSELGFVRLVPGIESTGQKSASQEELKVLGSTFSPRLLEIVRETNCHSNNFYAETLLKILAKVETGSVKADSNVEVAERLLASYKVPVSGRCQVFDASGLSRKNYISASYFVDFLRMMWNSDIKDAYLYSLPMPGGEGTLEYKFMNAPQEFRSRIRMKSGSMNGVRCYSGYILSSDGNPDKTIIFSLMTNNVTESSWFVNPSIDRIIEAIAAEN